MDSSGLRIRNVVKHRIVFNVLTFVSFAGASGVLKLLFVETPSFDRGGGTPISILLNLFIYLFSFFYIWQYINSIKNIKGILLGKEFILLLIYIALSSFWTLDSIIENFYTSFIHLIGAILIALALCLSLIHSGGILNTKLLWGINLCLAVTAVYHLVFPELSMSYLEGRYSSIFASPNNLGQFAALAVLYIFLFEQNLLRKSILILISCYLLFIAQSYTSIIGLIFCLILFAFRIRPKLLKTLVITLFVVFSVLPFVYDTIINQLSGDFGGRDLSFTGRTTIWGLLFEDIDKNFFFGYGYSGFWGLENAPSSLLVENFGTQIMQGHNGYFDLIVDLGVIGYILFFVLMLQSFKNIGDSTNSITYGFSLIVVFICINNITESSFLKSKHLLNLQFLLIIFFFHYFRKLSDKMKMLILDDKTKLEVE